MRNLRNIDHSQLGSPTGLELTASAWDVATDSVLCAFGPTKDNVLLELKRWRKREETYEPIASWEAPCPLPDLECDQVQDLHYFSDSLTTCLILAGGDIVVVREEPQPGEEKVEIVGSVDAGIAAASWSPDEELLAIATEVSTLVYMTREFDPVADVTFTTDDLKASNHVSVGWGKKETQFKGKKARALRDPTVPETVDEGILSDLDTKDLTISWRGDGAYVAVNSIEAESRRVIRVYSREGLLDSVSEPVDGLVGALSWRPAGDLLAGVQLLRDQAKVVFFERNGLRHGQFDLRLSKEKTQDWASNISLQWNVDSSVLAVSFRDWVQLWNMGNYHYYLKQEVFSLPKGPNGNPASVVWHPEKALHILMLSSTGIQRQAYASVVSSSRPTSPHDYGIVAVIDGKQLKLTPMRFANVPPPMAFCELNLDRNVNDVVINASCDNMSSILIEVYFSHGGHAVYGWSMELKGQQQPSLVDPTSPLANIDPRGLPLECNLPTVEVIPWLEEMQPQKNGLPNGDEALHGREIRFSLHENGSLFANERRLVRNCDSFLVTPAHLIFTTSQHLLKFVHLGAHADGKAQDRTKCLV
jgi:elongator complex protein 1